MRLGVKSLMLLVLFISNASAGWNENAWPSQSSYRLVPPASTTQLWGRLRTDLWTQTSTTNYMPQVTGTVDGFHFHIGSYTNDARVLTNQYYTFIGPDVSTNAINSWTNTYALTNVFEWTQAGMTNAVTSVLNGSEQAVFGDELMLHLEDVWALDTYNAIHERWQAVTWTTNYIASESFHPKPEFYRGSRDYLVSAKTWIANNAESFVDRTKEQSNSFDTYFATATDWTFHTWTTNYTEGTGTNCVVITETNSLWIADVFPDDFPRLSKQRLIDIVGLPYEAGEIYTNTITETVPGWFAGSLTNEFVDSYQWDVVYTTAPTRTWFDYTPHRDLGGWGRGLSNEQAGVWVIDVWADNADTNRYQLFDSWGTPYYYEIVGTTNTNGVVVSVDFGIYQVLDVTTNAATTNTVSAYSPVTNGPPIQVAFVIPESVVTNAVPGFSGAITNQVFAETYTNAVIVTNAFTAISGDIATGTREGDYGYTHIPAIMSNLVWTALGGPVTYPPTYDPIEDAWAGGVTNYGAFAGQWWGCGGNDVEVDNSSWEHMATNNNPIASAWRIAWTEPPPEPEEVCPPPAQTNISECVVRFFGSTKEEFSKGRYLLTEHTTVGDTNNVPNPLTYSEIDWSEWVWFDTFIVCFDTDQEAVTYVYEIENYDRSCINSTGWDVTAMEFSFTYTYIGPCEPDDPFACGTDNYNYSYYRNSQKLRWGSIWTNVATHRAEYYRASNPVQSRELPSLPPQPDSEDFFAAQLRNTFAYYNGDTSNSIEHEQDDFRTDIKPLADDPIDGHIDRKGWRIEAGRLLLKWDIENGFEY